MAKVSGYFPPDLLKKDFEIIFVKTSENTIQMRHVDHHIRDGKEKDIYLKSADVWFRGRVRRHKKFIPKKLR